MKDARRAGCRANPEEDCIRRGLEDAGVPDGAPRPSYSDPVTVPH